MFVKKSPLEQRDAHGPQVVAASDVKQRPEIVLRSRLGALGNVEHSLTVVLDHEVGRGSCGFDAGSVLQSVNHSLEKRAELLRLIVTELGKTDSESHQVVRLESWVDPAQRGQRTDGQSGANHQDRRQRELRDHEYILHVVMPPAAGTTDGFLQSHA